MPDSPVIAKLKWFNVPKGFGFVVPENGNYDAFLHITALQDAGVTRLGEGASLLCHIERGHKGAQVTEVVELLDAGIEPAPVRAKCYRGDRRDGALSNLTGTVKLYDAEKRFGFVVADDGQKDVFLHRKCLEHHGLQTLKPGVRIIMNVRPTPEGREVVDFEFLDE